MLGFVVCKREVDSDADLSLGHAHASPDRGLSFDDLTSLTSLNPSVSGGEGLVDWPLQHGRSVFLRWGWVRVRARVERLPSSTRQRVSALLQVQRFNARGGTGRFLTKLHLTIWSRITTIITKDMKPIRVRTQYSRLRPFTSMPVPRNAGGLRRRRDCSRLATIAGATRAGPKCAVQ